MKASELKIGNWYRSKEFNKDFLMDKEMLIDILEDDEEEKYQGVPLTKEWLIKFGFFQGFGKGLFHINITEDNLMAIELNSEFVMLGDEITLQHNIEHVHQLQNLFHALTGKELIIAL